MKDLLWLGLLALVCLFFTGFFSAAETAFSRLSKARVEDLVQEGRKRAPLLAKIVEHKTLALTATRGVRIVFSTLATVIIVLAVNFDWWPTWVRILTSVIISAGAAWLISGLFGDSIGSRNPETVALLAARPVWATTYLLAPLTKAYLWVRPEAGQTEAEARQLMAEDLREMVDDLGEDENLEIEDEDRELLRSVFELGTTLVREIMVPRTEMITVDKDLPATKAISLFVKSGFSRLPVTGEDTDDVRGVLVLKDILGRVHRNSDSLSAPIHTMMRPILFVPETVLLDDLLRQMQASGDHMAMLVDEYGGISGLVTLEDLIEEVVGDVTDEHDHSKAEPHRVDAGVWEVPANFPLDDLGGLFDLEIEDEDVDTAAGLLAKALGKVPLAAASASIQGLDLTAGEATGRRRTITTVIARERNEDK